MASPCRCPAAQVRPWRPSSPPAHPKARRGRGLREVRTLEDQARWYDDASAGWPTRVCFTVYELAGSRAIGISELRGISSEYGCATLAISLGERRGQGLGSEAVRLTLE